MAGARIACIGVIGKDDNPLHTSLFPPYLASGIEFSLLLNSCLDIFEIRQKQTLVDQDLGLLHAVDERLAAYGWLTNTGIKFIAIVDLAGQPISAATKDPRVSTVAGIRDSDVKPVFRALQTAYVQLLQNPFYSPSDPASTARVTVPTHTSLQAANARFVKEIERIGSSWLPGRTIST